MSGDKDQNDEKNGGFHLKKMVLTACSVGVSVLHSIRKRPLTKKVKQLLKTGVHGVLEKEV